MNIIISTKHIELADSLKAYVEEKIGSLSHFLPVSIRQTTEVAVEVGKPSQHHHSGPVYFAAANLHLGGTLLRATHNHDDLYAAIDYVKDELHRQLIKFKDRQLSKRRQGTENKK